MDIKNFSAPEMENIFEETKNIISLINHINNEIEYIR